MSKNDAEEIRDVDIRENNKTRLRFRKMPWQELVTFILLASISLFCIYMREYHSPWLTRKGGMFKSDSENSDEESDPEEGRNKLK